METDSIKTKKGIKADGAPIGAKCAIVFFFDSFIPVKIIILQKIIANDEFVQIELVILYPNGINPSKLYTIRIIINILIKCHGKTLFFSKLILNILFFKKKVFKNAVIRNILKIQG